MPFQSAEPVFGCKQPNEVSSGVAQSSFYRMDAIEEKVLAGFGAAAGLPFGGACCFTTGFAGARFLAFPFGKARIAAFLVCLSGAFGHVKIRIEARKAGKCLFQLLFFYLICPSFYLISASFFAILLKFLAYYLFYLYFLSL